MIRIGSIDTGGEELCRAITVDYRLRDPDAVLARIDESLDLLEPLVDAAGQRGCDIAVLPEDTLGLSAWKGANPETRDRVLPEAVRRMLDRLGRTAAGHRMYLICCNDRLESADRIYNTAYLLGRDGREIGRYDKVCLPVQEHLKQHGERFPVYDTPDLGGVGMLICYDMVFPEAARCLALNGADILFNPTVGGAAFGGAEISRAAFRTRAVENFVYLVVSWGGWNEETGSMIISPHGEILAEEKKGGRIAVADVDPFGGRQVGDWSNWQEDMRVRLFRERRPAAYAVLADPHPPVLDKLPPLEPGTPEQIARIVQQAMTVGHGRFQEAEDHFEAGRTQEAIAAYEALIADYPATWFDRTARQRLEQLRKSAAE